MPWSDTSAMNERIRFLADHQLGVFSVTELYARCGIGRTTCSLRRLGMRSVRSVRDTTAAASRGRTRMGRF
jgi:hypothetical protein